MFDAVFLGTGAMKPTPRRFTSSLMLRYRGEVFMFDAGEGIQVRVQQGGFSPMKLGKVFITHFHGDHFFGLPGLLFTLKHSERTDPISVYGPEGTHRYMQVLVSLGGRQPPFQIDVEELEHGSLIQGEGYSISAFRTVHGPPSLGYIFREADRVNVDTDKMEAAGLRPDPKFRLLKQGKEVEIQGQLLKPDDWLVPVPGDSLAYVGDTVYSGGVVEAVRGVTVLVHEATHLSGDVEGDRGHSSAADAARVAKEAGVGTLLLTHISSRYADPQPLLDEAREIFPNTHLPEDLQKIQVKKGEVRGI